MQIHLQGVGFCPAKPAGELQVGDVTLWNYGSMATVESIRRTSASVFLTMRDAKRLYAERRYSATRLVGIMRPRESARLTARESALIPPSAREL